MGYPKKHRGRRKIGSKEEKSKKKKQEKIIKKFLCMK